MKSCLSCFRNFSCTQSRCSLVCSLSCVEDVIQHWRCSTLGVDVSWVVVGCNSLDVHKACGLDVLHKEGAQHDGFGALVEPKPVAEAECRCAVGKRCESVIWTMSMALL